MAIGGGEVLTKEGGGAGRGEAAAESNPTLPFPFVLCQ